MKYSHTHILNKLLLLWNNTISIKKIFIKYKIYFQSSALQFVYLLRVFSVGSVVFTTNMIIYIYDFEKVILLKYI